MSSSFDTFSNDDDGGSGGYMNYDSYSPPSAPRRRRQRAAPDSIRLRPRRRLQHPSHPSLPGHLRLPLRPARRLLLLSRTRSSLAVSHRRRGERERGLRRARRTNPPSAGRDGAGGGLRSTGVAPPKCYPSRGERKEGKGTAQRNHS
ncbi:clathrin light chain 2-like [Iris pallida]|uniref:Clathrin light chain 2-like n=1 Tax=Iris pallida TaxID=29817 RepID=A0AAX6FG60_IRIPA|nr:clathrin light chain 2-like [Iris pallida]